MLVNDTVEPALSPLKVEIVKLSGPSIVKFNFAALPATVVSVSAEISITPPSSTPSERAVCGDLGNDVKCNSVALKK